MKSSIALSALALAAGGASAQSVSFTGGAYAQDFDGLAMSGALVVPGRGPHTIQGVLGSVGVEGWYGMNILGTSADFEFKAHNGGLAGNAGRGVISFGANGSSERALGALPTSNQISRFGAVFTNNSGETIDEITIAYTGEQWRRGNVGLPNVLEFTWGFGATIELANTRVVELDFESPNMQAAPTEVAIDGNDPSNRQEIEWTITGLNWGAGEDLAIAWTIQDITGQDNGLGIDDFRLSAGEAGCYPDCDQSTGPSVLDIFDFLCFGNLFSAGDPYACDCDLSTGPGVCDIFDFLCFGNAFQAGCP